MKKLLPSQSFLFLSKFFLFHVTLPLADIATDVLTGVKHIQRVRSEAGCIYI